VGLVCFSAAVFGQKPGFRSGTVGIRPAVGLGFVAESWWNQFWVLGVGANGRLFFLSAKTLKVLAKMEAGNSE